MPNQWPDRSRQDWTEHPPLAPRDGGVASHHLEAVETAGSTEGRGWRGPRGHVSADEVEAAVVGGGLDVGVQ